MKTPPLLTAERLAAENLGFAQEEFHAADALADAALEAVADFCGRMKAWRTEEVQILAELNARAEAAESRRLDAHLARFQGAAVLTKGTPLWHDLGFLACPMPELTAIAAAIPRFWPSCRVSASRVF